MTSTGRRGFVAIDRRWLADERMSSTMIHLMLWLDSHSDEYLSALDIKRTAEELGWSRDRVMRAVTELEELGLISTELVKSGLGKRTRFTLNLDLWTDRAAKHDTGVQRNTTHPVQRNTTRTTSNPSSEESNVETPQPPSTTDIAERDMLGEFFDLWWHMYPRKVGKPAALKAMKARFKGEFTPIEATAIAEGTRRWMNYWQQAETEDQFIPHPSTFLNQQRYLDDSPAPPKKKQSPIMESINKIREHDQ